jgi:hypothetical protein
LGIDWAQRPASCDLLLDDHGGECGVVVALLLVVR